MQTICQSLIQEITDGPKPSHLLALLALSEFNIATVQVVSRDFECIRVVRKVARDRSALVDAHPSVNVYKENLAASYLEVGIAQHQAGQDNATASATLQKGVAILERLIAGTPEQARYHAGLGRTLNALGYCSTSRAITSAIPEFRKAIKEQELAIARSPDDNEYKLYLCNHLENLGEQYADLGRASDGLAYYERALDMRRRIYHDRPELAGYALPLADALSVLGAIEARPAWRTLP